jgi:hypothetical protein
MNPPDRTKLLLQDEHFRAFGAIMHTFARHESLMVGVISVLMNADIPFVSMITAELPYRGKVDTLKAMMKVKLLPAAQIEKINGYLGELKKWNALRNAIAHSTWKEGDRPGSVKPFGLSVRGGDATFTGLEEEERDYTAEELINIANQLINLRDRFRRYLKSVDLLPKAAANDGD